MEKFIKIFSFLDPIFLYYAIAYVLSKVYQKIFNESESVWQIIWNKFMDIFGDDEATYNIIILNAFVLCIYWGFGLTFMLMEKFHKPKILKNFKIQGKKKVLDEQKHNLIHVS